MPYQKKEDLPESVKSSLPSHALEIFMKAYNSARDQYSDPGQRSGDSSREETAMKVAWSAVKKQYKKSDDGQWVKK
ncbi:MAG: cation transport regulator ChaB [Candidatus Moranbacteria bacterium]|nr:cation transport regulator ChaB [Candidatus Moranbacteria bacterium]